MTTPPTLQNLNFEEIKTSLTDYLKKQTIFQGYEFEGSVIQTLIDLLAYNTYYYAFYSNMMSNEVFLDSAQRITSLVSLVKPLGYTVPGKKSASALIKASINSPAYTLFNGVLSDGRYYTFYNKSSAIANEEVEIVEANRLVYRNEITGIFDYNLQRYIIDEPDIDISTIRLEISEDGGNTWDEWENVNYFPNTDEKIFYIDRYGDIFVVQLGKENTLGQSLISGTHKIRITYLISSGSVANDISTFSISGGSVESIRSSYGANDGPDIDLIKFAAPKSFSGQERAVTKNDYYGLLLKNGFFNNITQFAVYGGEEIHPPKYGRVFISFLSAGVSHVRNILEFLRNKNVLTVLPEYQNPILIDGEVDFDTVVMRSLSQPQQEKLRSDIIAFFDAEYNSSEYRFGRQFNFNEFRNLVMEKFAIKGLSDISFNGVKYKTILGTSTELHQISLQNSITGGSVSITPEFTTIDNKQMIIKLPVKTQLPIANLDVFEVLLNGAHSKRDIDAGSVHWEKGFIEIKTIFASDLTVTIPSSTQTIAPITNSMVKLSLQ